MGLRSSILQTAERHNSSEVVPPIPTHLLPPSMPTKVTLMMLTPYLNRCKNGLQGGTPATTSSPLLLTLSADHELGEGFPTVVSSEVDLLKQQSTPCDNDAMPVKTPASLLSGIYATYLSSLCLTMIGTTVIGLLISRVWHRTLAKIQRMYSGGASPETSTTRPSPATRLPQEIVEMIIAYLIYDKRSLCACASTRYSWHIAVVPHLHHTLTIDTYCPQVFWWADRLLFMHMLGLLPLVKTFRIRGLMYSGCVGVSPKLFNCCILLQFYALTNIRELEIQFLDIPNFLPRNLRYSRHFLPNI